MPAQVFREDKPAREVTVLGEVELISWVKVEDLSEDKKGGLLLRMLEEGGQGPDGYKKPKDLSTCCVQYKIVAAVKYSLPKLALRCPASSRCFERWLCCDHVLTTLTCSYVERRHGIQGDATS